MFGYVLVNKPELKIKEFDLYKSYYCGLCHTLKDRYGQLGRMTLNYDMTFLVMLLCDLYDEKDSQGCSRCVVHPVQKHCSRTNAATEYCADMCMLLTYYKCLDDWNDDRKISKGILSKILALKCKKVWKDYPKKAEFVKAQLAELSAIERSVHREQNVEKAGCKVETAEKSTGGKAQTVDEASGHNAQNIDEAARTFGKLMAEIFVYKDDYWKEDLYKVGFYLGKFIYLLDAYEDIEKDIKSGSYNPFKEMYQEQDFDQKVLDLLMLMIGECTDAFERLPLVENIEILRNILYSGVWVRFAKKQKDKEEVIDESL